LPLGDAIETSFEIQGLAMAAAGLDHPDRALRLYGAGARIWEQTGVEIGVPFWTTLLDRYLALARDSVPPDEASRAWEEGRGLSFENAIAEALAPVGA
jgi:hypothetical protein